MSDPTEMEDSPNMFMDDRLNLQALKNKRYLDKTLDFDFFTTIEKKELLAMLLKSTILMHEGATHIAKQRTSLIHYQLKEINSL